MNKGVLFSFLVTILHAEQASQAIISASEQASQGAQKAMDELVDQLDKGGAKAALKMRDAIEAKPKQACQSSLTDKVLSPSKKPVGQLLVFVSSSLSNSALRELATDVAKVGGKLIFRGLINNSFKDTHSYFKEAKITADIDPTQFDTYQVQVVPTYVLTDTKGERFDKLQGHVSVREALSQFKDRGELKDSAKKLLRSLEEGF